MTSQLLSLQHIVRILQGFQKQEALHQSLNHKEVQHQIYNTRWLFSVGQQRPCALVLPGTQVVHLLLLDCYGGASTAAEWQPMSTLSCRSWESTGVLLPCIKQPLGCKQENAQCECQETIIESTTCCFQIRILCTYGTGIPKLLVLLAFSE